jgi:hypothetical protein
MNRFTALRSVLANLYPTQEDARRIVTDTGLNLAYIQFSDKAINNWQNILSEAEKHDCLDALLEVVLEEYGTNPALLKAMQMVDTANPQRSTAAPHTSTIYNVNTGGGTFVAGDVNTDDDFIGRDSHKLT